MNVRPRGGLVALVLALTSVLPAPSPPSRASDVPGRPGVSGQACHATGWREVRLPDRARTIGMDIAVVRGRATWIVGMRAGTGRPRQPWALRRTVSGWRPTLVPGVGADAGLVAIDASNAAAAVAVGFRADGRMLRPVALAWTGGRWADISPAAPTGGASTLTDVSAGRETWAVGYRTAPGGPRPYALQRRSGHWVRHDPTLGARGFGSLVTVASVPRRGTWAAGWRSQGRPIQPLLVRWRGGRWQPEPLPGVLGHETVVTDLVEHRGQPWAIGYRVDGSHLRPVAWRRVDASWRTVVLPHGSASMLPEALVVRGHAALTIVGAARDADRSGLVHAVAEPLADAVGLTRRPAGIGGSTHLRAAVLDGGRAMAVGWTSDHAIAIRSCRSALATRPASSRQSRPPGGRPNPMAEASAPASVAATAGNDLRPVVGARPAVAVRFRDVARRVGLDMTTKTYGATALDANADGWEDLVISRHQERARVLLGGRRGFRPAPADPLPGRDRHGCAAGDIDGDRRDEVTCAIGAARGVKTKSNELYLDLMDGRGGSDAGPTGVADHLGRGRRATFLQLDGDGDPDLLVTNDPLRVDGLPSLNRLYRNEGGRFEPVPELGLDLPLGGECAFSAQLDGAGRQEVGFCTLESARAGARGLRVFRWRDGRYVDATRALGLRSGGEVDAVAADIDGDGRQDVAQLSPSRLVVSLQRAGKLRRVASLAVRSGQALAAGDVNGDGRADLYVVQGGPGNADDQLLVTAASGTAFRRASIPQARSGSADDVVSLDHDHNGLDDFLVLNGHDRAGPVQLIAAFRR